MPILGWILGIGLFLVLAVLLHLSVGWRALLAPWGEIPPGRLAMAALLVFGSYAVRSIRIHQYFLPETRGGFGRALRVMLLHNLFNNLLPARSGEASFPLLMKREFRIAVTRSLPALLYLRFLDLHFLLVLGGGILAWGRGLPAWGLLLILTPLPWLAYAGKGWLEGRLDPEGPRWERMAAEGLNGLPSTPGRFWWIWLWTALNWTVKLLAFAWILMAFLDMPYTSALLGSVTGELSSVLPIHGLAGAGTYEGGILAALLPLGIGAEPALAAAVNLHLFVLGVSVLGALLALLLPVGARPSGELDVDS